MKKSISALCVTTMLLNLNGCGTILYPERNGQAKGGKIDIGVVLLDGIGLFFFIIPGVIAYAVDFISGTIYLPNGGGHNYTGAEGFNKEGMIALHVGKENLTSEKIKAIVSANVGYDIDIDRAQAYKIDENGKKL